MQGMESDFSSFLVQEQVTFSKFPPPQTWLVQGSGCSELIRPVLKPEGVALKVRRELIAAVYFYLVSRHLCGFNFRVSR